MIKKINSFIHSGPKLEQRPEAFYSYRPPAGTPESIIMANMLEENIPDT